MFNNDDRNTRTLSLIGAKVAFNCMQYIPVGASARSRQAHKNHIQNYIQLHY
jgi:hypothetical protein